MRYKFAIKHQWDKMKAPSRRWLQYYSDLALERMRTKLAQPEAWLKHTMHRQRPVTMRRKHPVDAYCLLGAKGAVLQEMQTEFAGRRGFVGLSKHGLLNDVVEARLRAFIKQDTDGAFCEIPQFNDAKNTSKEDVLLVLKRTQIDLPVEALFTPPDVA